MTERPTIFALSSGRPPAAIAVIRISGSHAGDALTALGVKIPQPRKAALARIRDADNEIIDEALALWFPAPHSETGEDTAELQLHGGRAVIAATLDALGRVEGLRPAEAGEFTRRAFENGKLDLPAVEGLADLVAAETQGQRRQAFRQMKGLLGGWAETWRQQLIQALALVEARIDFSDEGDVPENLVQPALDMARVLADEIGIALADGGRGERLREGLVVAIAGPPNAGKSTLLNLLAKREAAIVSPHAGTTRDVIEVHLELAGLPVTLLDTAGIRETTDPVEMEGVRRARERAAGADLVLWVTDASAPDAGRPMAEGGAGLSPVIPERLAEGGRTRNPGLRPVVPGFLAQPFGLSRNDEGFPADSAPRPGSIFADRGYRFRGTDDLVAPAAAEPPSPLTSALDPATTPPSPAPPPSPPIWLIRNKIDLIQRDSGGGNDPAGGASKNESKIRSNKGLRFIANSELTDRSELNVQTNEPLPNVVNTRLTGKGPPVSPSNDRLFNISATSGTGFDLLLAELGRHAETFLAGAESALVTRARHRHTLEETLAALRRALCEGLHEPLPEDLLAEELRIASRALGRLTGAVDVEDILDVIFRDFCIGK